MDLKNLLFCSFLISSIMLSLCMESVITKIAYKKPLHLKNQKSYTKSMKKYVPIDMQSTESTLATLPKEDESQTTSLYPKELTQTADDSNSLEAISKEETTTETNSKTTSSTPLSDTSCTCGIFLGSQFVKGSASAPPKEEPVISTTLERSFGCTPIGQKQCQTKCLEQIVQHLPNSSKIMCASLDRDIRKEKAFLFVRNCNNKWHNTNLSAGREYCCKDGLPYNCPKK